MALFSLFASLKQINFSAQLKKNYNHVKQSTILRCSDIRWFTRAIHNIFFLFRNFLFKYINWIENCVKFHCTFRIEILHSISFVEIGDVDNITIWKQCLLCTSEIKFNYMLYACTWMRIIWKCFKGLSHCYRIPSKFNALILWI